MVKRESSRIIYEILRVTDYGALITEIISEVSLNFDQARHYLQMLRKSELLTCSSCDKTVYRTTSKGRAFVKTYEELLRLLPARSDYTDVDYSERKFSLRGIGLRELVLKLALYRKGGFGKQKCRACDQPFKVNETLVTRSLKRSHINYHKECFERLFTEADPLAPNSSRTME
jgi:predicted transcriptional regulator